MQRFGKQLPEDMNACPTIEGRPLLGNGSVNMPTIIRIFFEPVFSMRSLLRSYRQESPKQRVALF
jgi:hypothetical protein